MAADFIAGCVAGAAGLLVSQPFDTVKVRLQAQTSGHIRYTGALHCFKSIVRQETVFGLYKGLASPLIGNCLINTILFGFHGNLLKQFNNPGYTEVFLCGSAAGVVQSIVACPMELAKIRMQMEGVGKSPAELKHGAVRYNGSIDALVKIYKQENIKGCYRGMASTVIRDSAFGIYFVCYEFLCEQLTKLRADNSRSMLVSITAGGLTGIVSWAVVFPVDVIKTRLQMDGMNGTQQYRD
ncbi:mitochondrial basic amino acids transporter-like [Amphiura filiformis]|uniref:mitochondrial basic amino acids transporter-like n=1 Tax=Amphiura filiformis TaxID=82378 RepID=UPI003B21AE1B